MRIFPTSPSNFRMSNEPCEIGGYVFPKNTQFMFSYQIINSHPAHWINPNEFNPERFLNSSNESRKSNQYLQAFGGGHKVCPGKIFAMLHLKSFLVLLYRKWEVELVDMNALIKSYDITTRSCQQLE
ncbi:17738_t:CDS:1, partial [Gigaspora rosea]